MTPAAAVTATTLVTGPSAQAREAAIAAALQADVATAVILEGLAEAGSALLEDAAQAKQPQLLRIAPGCLCCSGNLVLRVTLNRLLRRPPAQLYISLANAAHLEQLRQWLTDAPYGALLRLQADIAV